MEDSFLWRYSSLSVGKLVLFQLNYTHLKSVALFFALQLVKAAHKCTLLIHEATFEDGMKSEAIAKRHSTTAEAMSVAAEAQAYRTILTHFSTRYPTMPELSSRPDVGIAMDFMSVNLLGKNLVFLT